MILTVTREHIFESRHVTPDVAVLRGFVLVDDDPGLHHIRPHPLIHH